MQQILFVHNNFPAQFLHLSQALVRTKNVRVAAIGSSTARAVSGVKLLKYSEPQFDLAPTHPFARRFDAECARAEQVLYTASHLISSGFVPDVILAHPGWGETLPLRTIFPKARIVTYCEFFYRALGQDVGFDPEFPDVGIDGKVRLHLKNAATLLALEEADAGLSPTSWQRSTYPKEFQSKIQVIHEGVDTDVASPSDRSSLTLQSGRVLTKSDEVVTFASRHHEPLRGFHVFMRALPRILSERKRAQILIMGGGGSGYGHAAPEGKSWRSIFLDEVGDRVDLTRIHFTGDLSHENFIKALQISSAHIYLTYPFVLSWSMLEAMSAGCLVIGSSTPPVQEVIDGTNGILVHFFDSDHLATSVIEVLSKGNGFTKLREAARTTILNRYDSHRICLPRLLEFLDIKA